MEYENRIDKFRSKASNAKTALAFESSIIVASTLTVLETFKPEVKGYGILITAVAGGLAVRTAFNYHDYNSQANMLEAKLPVSPDPQPEQPSEQLVQDA